MNSESPPASDIGNSRLICSKRPLHTHSCGVKFGTAASTVEDVETSEQQFLGAFLLDELVGAVSDADERALCRSRTSKHNVSRKKQKFGLTKVMASSSRLTRSPLD